MKIAICIPSRDQWSAVFGFCLARLTGQFRATHPNVKLRILYVRGSHLPNQRADLVEAALEWGATHLLWLDTDMRFPGDTLARLLQHEAPVIAANYVKRKPPHTPVTVGLDGKPVYTTKETHGLETVSHTGMGVTLVRAEVFKQIERPWFAFPWLPKASRCAGEDTFFYSQLQRAGIKPTIDHDLSREVTHVGEAEITYEMAEMVAETIGEEDAA